MTAPLGAWGLGLDMQATSPVAGADAMRAHAVAQQSVILIRPQQIHTVHTFDSQKYWLFSRIVNALKKQAANKLT